MTRVFISWSTERSKSLAAAVKQLVRLTVPGAEPWFSPDDVKSGSVAISTIFGELRDADYGFVCLTNENRERPWPVFEAGALAKKVGEAHVVSVTLDFEPTNAPGPLSLLQGVAARDRVAWLKTLKELNGECEHPGDEDILDTHFETAWALFVEAIDAIPESASKGPPERTVDDRLEAMQAQLDRIEHSAKENRLIDGGTASESFRRLRPDAPIRRRQDRRSVISVMNAPPDTAKEAVLLEVDTLGGTTHVTAAYEGERFSGTINPDEEVVALDYNALTSGEYPFVLVQHSE